VDEERRGIVGGGGERDRKRRPKIPEAVAILRNAMARTRKTAVLVLLAAGLGAQPAPEDPAASALSRGDYKAARQALEERVRLAPGDPILRQRLANVLARMHRFDLAARELQVARAMRPDDHAILYDLAASLTNLGRYSEALSHWRELEALAQSRPELQSRAEIPFNRGRTASRLDLVPEAIEALGRAVHLAPRDTTIREELAGVLLNAGRNAEAAQQFQELVRQAPHVGSHHHFLGTAYMALDEEEKAEASLREARRLDPKDYRAPLRLGRLFLRQRRYDHALTLFLEARELNALASEACYGIAQVYAARGDDAQAAEWQARFDEVKAIETQGMEAVRSLRRRIAQDPKDESAHLELIEILIRHQSWATSEEALRAMLLHLPDHDVALMNMAGILARRRDFASARWEIDKVLERQPGHPFANLEMGRLFLVQGQSKDALPHLLRAAQKLPAGDDRRVEAIDLAVEAGLRAGEPARVLDLVLEGARIHAGHVAHERRLLVRALQVGQRAAALERVFPLAQAAFPRLDPSQQEERTVIEFLAAYAEQAGLPEARIYRARLSPR
jgi:tetratricopeptide (TPR) repeat protein